ncbi:MAG: DUF6273 domain-containing protein, partial [Lachnospiraceae bacterium]|nr:DUF6273 domain-containing protein [Lachnospiraceae bacterium]
MRKRILLVILAVLMLSLCACSKDEGADTQEPTKTEAQENGQKPTKAEEQENMPTQAAEKIQENDPTPAGEETMEKDPTPAQELTDIPQITETPDEPEGQVYYVDADGYVVMGYYEQDNNTDNGKEPIEWEILGEDENGKLLISRYVLDGFAYDELPDDGSEYVCTWGDCTLRAMLNGEFYETVFSAEEKQLIKETKLLNPGNTDFGSLGGEDTLDRIFILSMEELCKYYTFEYESSYSSDKYGQSLITMATPYAESRDIYNFQIDELDYEGEGDVMPLKDAGYSRDVIGMQGAYWRLRTPGADNEFTGMVSYYGEANSYGYYVYEKGYYGIRPAMYISSDATAVEYTGEIKPFKFENGEENTDPVDDPGQDDGTAAMSDPLDPETGIRVVKDSYGNVAAAFYLPDGYVFENEYSTPSDLYFHNDETEDDLMISLCDSLRFDDLLESGRQFVFNNTVVYTDSETLGKEDSNEDNDDSFEYSHTVIHLGYDQFNDNRKIYSVVEYGDVPLTYRLLYTELGEGKWLCIRSNLFQQDGILN